jgi:hypothetical protein
MTKADSVHSTPRITASKINPLDPMRRRLLTIAAGGAVAAAIPAAALTAAPAVDLIYAAIERHKAAKLPYEAAVTVRACYDEADEKVTQQMDEAVDAAFDVYEDAGADLVNTEPTTLAGIVALCRYIEPLLNDGSYLPEVISWDDETESSAAGAFANVIAAAVEALIKA